MVLSSNCANISLVEVQLFGVFTIGISVPLETTANPILVITEFPLIIVPWNSLAFRLCERCISRSAIRCWVRKLFVICVFLDLFANLVATNFPFDCISLVEVQLFGVFTFGISVPFETTANPILVITEFPLIIVPWNSLAFRLCERCI